MKDLFFTVSIKTDDVAVQALATLANFGAIGLQIILYAYLIGLGFGWGFGL